MTMFRYLNSKNLGSLTIGLAVLCSFNYKKPTYINESDCNVKGIYAGKSTSKTGGVNSMVYMFLENNFTKGGKSINDMELTFGGYRNTCNSIFLSVFYTENSCYYLLEGKLSNNSNTIDGIFKNLTNPSDTGTFIINKVEVNNCNQPNL